VLASAELIILGEALSLAGAVGATGYALGQAVLLVASLWVWRRRGFPLPPEPCVHVRAGIRRHPVLAALGLVVGVAIVYQLFIAIATPPNNWDSMSYHLPRAAEWLQRGRVEYVPDPPTERMNATQPGSELEILWTLAFLGRDTAAALPQLFAELASLVCVYSIARRVGFGRPDSMFAALLAATLTQVALQSVTTQNDLLSASFVLAAAALILGGSRAEVVLAGLALALALGTKLTAVYAIPILVGLAVVALPRRRLVACLAASMGAFVLVGAYGYVLNLVETGRPLGDPSATKPYRPAALTWDGTEATVARIGFRFFDLSGLHAKSAVVDVISDSGRSIFDALGIAPNPPETSVAPAFDFEVGQSSSEDISYFGPLGVLLVVPLSLGFAVVTIARPEQWGRLALALALPLIVLEIALTYRYNIWLGRFLVTPVLLTMPLAAVLYRRRALAAAVALVGCVTLVAAHAFNAAKPTGLEGTRAVWSLARPEAQALTRPGIESVLVAIDRRIPDDARVGFAALDEWAYPLYGADLERRIVPLPRSGPLAAADRLGLDWVVVGTPARGRTTRPGWRRLPFPESGWTLFSR
jgi:4-amino-4-deoxy-L-arabinose transferase-like glycosyltransferase